MDVKHRSPKVNSNWNYVYNTLVSLVFFFFKKYVFIQKTQIWAHYFKLFNRVQTTEDEKAHFIKGNELKLGYFF